MKKYIVALVMVGLLFGCSDRNESLVLSEKGTASTPETTAETTTAEEITTESESVSDGYNFKVEADGIYFFKGSIFQKIELDCSELLECAERYNEEPEYFLVIEDFNFVDYDDLFVPYGVGTPNIMGTYFYMNPTRDFNPFEEWDEMNKIGKKAYAIRKNAIKVYQNNVEGLNVTAYQWDNGTLKAIGYRVREASDEDGKFTITDYNFDENGEKVFAASYEAGEAPDFYE